MGDLMLQTSVYERDTILLSSSDKELWLVRRVGVVWANPAEDQCALLKEAIPFLPSQASALLAKVLKLFPKLLRGSFLFHSVAAQPLVHLQLHLKGQFYQQSHHLSYASTSPSTKWDRRSTFLSIKQYREKLA